MYSTLNAALNWSDTPKLNEHFILITDTNNADGSFLLHHFVNMYVKANHFVCFVGLDQGFFHYFSISRKLGVNLKTAFSQGNYIFVNGLSSPYEWTDDVSCDSPNDQVAALRSIANAHPISLQTDTAAPLKSLLDLLKRLVATNNKSNKPTLIVVDNLTLLSLAASATEVILFAQQLKAFASQQPFPCLFVALAHADPPEARFVRALIHRSDLTLVVSGFTLGQFTDVDGVVSVLRNGHYNQPELQYKVSENNVHFSPLRREVKDKILAD